MTARKMLLGLGSPFTQSRVDFNLLHGTDTSSGTYPFTSPASLNDGNAATHADRAAVPHAGAYIVQSASKDGTGVGPKEISLPNPVTAGNLLVLHFVKGASGNANLNGSDVLLHGTLTARPFSNQVYVAILAGQGRPMTVASRVATGDEQNLDIAFNDFKATIYEIGFAAAWASEETLFKDQQASSGTKALGSYPDPGALRTESYAWNDTSTGQSPGSGYAQDAQIDGALPAFLSQHDDGPGAHTPQITGAAFAWAGIGVRYATSQPDTTSICQADLGAAYPVNRMTLLESSDTGTQYAVSYSTDGASWTPLSPTFTDLGGGLQQYDLAATVMARYWRIADNHSPAVALGALAWDTWTIQGFPL